MPNENFETNIFINCPFDDEYAPILQAVLFCVVYLGFNPRLSTERADSAENRLSKIVTLIRESKFSIHDLSRCQAVEAGEHFRLNMPFELGIDYGSREFLDGKYSDKKILILESQRYRYRAAISDLSGCDIKVHSDDPQKAIRQVRNWLVSEAGIVTNGASDIYGRYTADFQEWHYEKQLKNGFSDEDIQDYPTAELLSEMKIWMDEGRPL